MFLLCVKHTTHDGKKRVTSTYLGDNLNEVSGAPFATLQDAEKRAKEYWEAEFILRKNMSSCYGVEIEVGIVRWSELGKVSQRFEWQITILDISRELCFFI